MDSIKKYFDKGQYDLVIKFTNDSLDEDSLFYRLESLVNLGKDDEALELIKEHGSLIETKQFEVMKIHLSILYSHKKYGEIRQTLEYYDSLPYISYEVEEFLKEQYKNLDNRDFSRNKEFHNLSVDEIKDLLLEPSSKEEMLYVFNAIRTMNVRLFLDEIQTFLLSDYDDDAKTFCLLVLIEQKVMEEISFLKKGVIYKVIPYELDAPLSDYASMEIIKKFQMEIKDPSIANVANELFAIYAVDIFPNEISEDEIDLLVASFTIIANQYLDSKCDTALVADKYNLNTEILFAKIEEISESLLKTQDTLKN